MLPSGQFPQQPQMGIAVGGCFPPTSQIHSALALTIYCNNAGPTQLMQPPTSSGSLPKYLIKNDLGIDVLWVHDAGSGMLSFVNGNRIELVRVSCPFGQQVISVFGPNGQPIGIATIGGGKKKEYKEKDKYKGAKKEISFRGSNGQDLFTIKGESSTNQPLTEMTIKLAKTKGVKDKTKVKKDKKTKDNKGSLASVSGDGRTFYTIRFNQTTMPIDKHHVVAVLVGFMEQERMKTQMGLPMASQCFQVPQMQTQPNFQIPQMQHQPNFVQNQIPQMQHQPNFVQNQIPFQQMPQMTPMQNFVPQQQMGFQAPSAPGHIQLNMPQ